MLARSICGMRSAERAIGQRVPDLVRDAASDLAPAAAFWARSRRCVFEHDYEAEVSFSSSPRP